MWKNIVILLFLMGSMTLNSIGQVSIDEPQEVSDLKEKYSAYNSEIETMPGWRIQILATTERRDIDQQKLIFKNTFPDLSYNEEYKKPYYRLTTGASLDRLSILPLLEEIKSVYPSSFVVRDKKIKKEELLKSYK